MSVTEQRRQREKQQRRRDIMRAARRLFWQGGYLGTTMPEIAEAVELAPGTLYLYFPSKRALYAELLLEGYDRLQELLEGELRPERPVRRQAEALIDAFFEFAQDRPEYFDIIFFVLQREVGGTRHGALEPEQVERLAAREDACKAIVARMLEDSPYADREGEQTATVDAVWSMLVGVTFYFRKEGPQALASVAERAKRLLLSAVFGPE
jgi:AcrR family transcriptional regulator